jgi:LPS sulfotransferase NodH
MSFRTRGTAGDPESIFKRGSTPEWIRAVAGMTGGTGIKTAPGKQ